MMRPDIMGGYATHHTFLVGAQVVLTASPQTMWGKIQDGAPYQWASRGKQAPELLVILRRVVRMAKEWGTPTWVIKLDVRKAFDSVWQESMGDLVARQGSPDSPVLFSRIIADDLQRALRDAQPLLGDNRGPPPPHSGGAFMDDTYLWGYSKEHLQYALSSLERRLASHGLAINPAKTAIIHSHPQGGGTFLIGGEQVACLPHGSVITALGSPVTFGDTVPVLISEMQHRARKAFHKNAKLLCSPTPLKARLKLHQTLVRGAALWGGQSWPVTDAIMRAINSTQLQQIRRMMHPGRKPGETWAEWNVRTLRGARVALQQSKVVRWSSFQLQHTWELYGHMARSKHGGRDMLQWRNLKWWEAEKNKPKSQRATHAHRYNPFVDTERQIVQVATLEWMDKACNMPVWSALAAEFVRQFDVPWATGKQPSIQPTTPPRAQAEQRQPQQHPAEGAQPQHSHNAAGPLPPAEAHSTAHAPDQQQTEASTSLDAAAPQQQQQLHRGSPQPSRPRRPTQGQAGPLPPAAGQPPQPPQAPTSTCSSSSSSSGEDSSCRATEEADPWGAWKPAHDEPPEDTDAVDDLATQHRPAATNQRGYGLSYYPPPKATTAPATGGGDTTLPTRPYRGNLGTTQPADATHPRWVKQDHQHWRDLGPAVGLHEEDSESEWDRVLARERPRRWKQPATPATPTDWGDLLNRHLLPREGEQQAAQPAAADQGGQTQPQQQEQPAAASKPPRRQQTAAGGSGGPSDRRRTPAPATTTAAEEDSTMEGNFNHLILSQGRGQRPATAPPELPVGRGVTLHMRSGPFGIWAAITTHSQATFAADYGPQPARSYTRARQTLRDSEPVPDAYIGVNTAFALFPWGEIQHGAPEKFLMWVTATGGQRDPDGADMHPGDAYLLEWDRGEQRWRPGNLPRKVAQQYYYDWGRHRGTPAITRPPPNGATYPLGQWEQMALNLIPRPYTMGGQASSSSGAPSTSQPQPSPALAPAPAQQRRRDTEADQPSLMQQQVAQTQLDDTIGQPSRAPEATGSHGPSPAGAPPEEVARMLRWLRELALWATEQRLPMQLRYELESAMAVLGDCLHHARLQHGTDPLRGVKRKQTNQVSEAKLRLLDICEGWDDEEPNQHQIYEDLNVIKKMLKEGEQQFYLSTQRQGRALLRQGGEGLQQ
ncbi:unnamed protein product, partial [Symbiodinium necroappetens]